MSKNRPSKADATRALRELAHTPVTPEAEAKSRESSFLKNLSAAHADYQWIVDNEAWTHLGHETYTSWFTARVHPMLTALGARPTPELAADVIKRVRDDDANLPAAQRHTNKEIADLAGVNERTIRRQSQDQDKRTLSAGSDLEKQPEDFVPGLKDAIDKTLDEQREALAEHETSAVVPPPAEDVDEPVSPSGSSTEDTPAGNATASNDDNALVYNRPGADTPPARDPEIPEFPAVATSEQAEEGETGKASGPAEPVSAGDDEPEESKPAATPPAGGSAGEEAEQPRAGVSGAAPAWQPPSWLTAANAYLDAVTALDAEHPHDVGRLAPELVKNLRTHHDKIADWLAYAENPGGT